MGKRKFYVYEIKLKCGEANRCYIGQTKSIKDRWPMHISEMQRGTKHSSLWNSDFKNYGLEGFSFSILKIVDSKEEALAEEERLIKEIGSLYNIDRERQRKLSESIHWI